jgi:tetratricopeptide (TPR) repeat protein
MRSLGDRNSEIDVLNNSGYWAFLHGNLGRARGLLEEALALSPRVWSTSNQATIKGNLALVDLFEGNLASAREGFLEALECSRNVGDTSQMREVMVGIAAICAETGHHQMALRLATAATADQSGEPSEAEPLIRHRYLDPLRSVLDAQQWTVAEAAGHEMGLDGAAKAAIEHRLLP